MEDPTASVCDTASVVAEEAASGRPEAAAATAAGAPLSNTAPANSMPPNVGVLLTGVDSLYVSYRGELNKGWDNRLANCK